MEGVNFSMGVLAAALSGQWGKLGVLASGEILPVAACIRAQKLSNASLSLCHIDASPRFEFLPPLLFGQAFVIFLQCEATRCIRYISLF